MNEEIKVTAEDAIKQMLADVQKMRDVAEIIELNKDVLEEIAKRKSKLFKEDSKAAAFLIKCMWDILQTYANTLEHAVTKLDKGAADFHIVANPGESKH